MGHWPNATEELGVWLRLAFVRLLQGVVTVGVAVGVAGSVRDAVTGASYQAKMSVVTHWKKRKRHWRNTYQIRTGVRTRL